MRHQTSPGSLGEQLRKLENELCGQRDDVESEAGKQQERLRTAKARALSADFDPADRYLAAVWFAANNPVNSLLPATEKQVLAIADSAEAVAIERECWSTGAAPIAGLGAAVEIVDRVAGPGVRNRRFSEQASNTRAARASIGNLLDEAVTEELDPRLTAGMILIRQNAWSQRILIDSATDLVTATPQRAALRNEAWWEGHLLGASGLQLHAFHSRQRSVPAVRALLKEALPRRRAARRAIVFVASMTVAGKDTSTQRREIFRRVTLGQGQAAFDKLYDIHTKKPRAFGDLELPGRANPDRAVEKAALDVPPPQTVEALLLSVRGRLLIDGRKGHERGVFLVDDEGTVSYGVVEGQRLVAGARIDWLPYVWDRNRLAALIAAGSVTPIARTEQARPAFVPGLDASRQSEAARPPAEGRIPIAERTPASLKRRSSAPSEGRGLM